jgi:dihydrodipicolinate synthase/N-acetylneuraminate lyase
MKRSVSTERSGLKGVTTGQRLRAITMGTPQCINDQMIIQCKALVLRRDASKSFGEVIVAETAPLIPLSVPVAIPPLARTLDCSISWDENLRIAARVRDGGLTTVVYAGNANFYGVSLREYAQLLEFFIKIQVSTGLAVVPSAGPDYGRLLDQAELLKALPFSTVMVLPATSPSTPAGAYRALRQFSECIGKPLALYLRSAEYLPIASIARLVDDGVVSWIKYSVAHSETDQFLEDLVERVDRRRVLGGFGELPTLLHARRFGVAGFGSGSACIAPRLSARLHRALEAKRWDLAQEIIELFRPLELLRNEFGSAAVLHDAMSLIGIAKTGPLLPLISNTEERQHAEIATAARSLLAHETELADPLHPRSVK